MDRNLINFWVFHQHLLQTASTDSNTHPPNHTIVIFSKICIGNFIPRYMTNLSMMQQNTTFGTNWLTVTSEPVGETTVLIHSWNYIPKFYWWLRKILMFPTKLQMKQFAHLNKSFLTLAFQNKSFKLFPLRGDFYILLG